MIQSLDQTVLTLFKNVPITRTALAKAQSYFNQTIAIHGVVESYLLALRKKDDPDHVIRDVFFPMQYSSLHGVIMDPEKLVAESMHIKETGLIPCGWLHHHCYSVLRPSSPPSDPNDLDGNKSLLSLFGINNYKQIMHTITVPNKNASVISQTQQLQLLDRNVQANVTFHMEKKDGVPGLQQALTDVDSITIELPETFSYVYCIIMNPTTPDPRKTSSQSMLRTAITKIGKTASNVILGDYAYGQQSLSSSKQMRLKQTGHSSVYSQDSYGHENFTQRGYPNLSRDVFLDPYVAVSYNRWASYLLEEIKYGQIEVRLKVIDDCPEKLYPELDHKLIAEEVKTKVQTNWKDTMMSMLHGTYANVIGLDAPPSATQMVFEDIATSIPTIVMNPVKQRYTGKR